MLMASCKENYDAPCRAVNYKSVTLTSFDKSFVPYTSADTLEFTSIPGGSISDVVINPENAYWVRTAAIGSNPECPPDSIQYEVMPYTVGFPSYQVLMHLDKARQELRFTIDSSTFRISFAALSSADSVYVNTAEWNGNNYSNVYLRTANADSLYYTRTSGIVRFIRGSSGYLMK